MCMTPITLKRKGEHDTHVPCGKCPDCVKGRISQWSFRLMQQERVAETSHFLTLTYDADHVYITKKGFMGLNKRDVQLFLKRLRKAHDKEAARLRAKPVTLKYYLVGEYGGRTHRPHYHAIIFNAILELIQPAWGLGDIHYGDVSGASVGYCLKYMSKPHKFPMHANDDRISEFALMSKGLGKEYLTAEKIAWHQADAYNRMYCPIEGGKKIGMPRYYKERIYEKNQRKLIGEFIRKEQMKQEYQFAADSPEFSRNRKESIAAAFRKMKADAFKNQKL